MKYPFDQLMTGSKKAVSYMIQEITHICRNLEKRAPGSPGERQAADYMAAVLKDQCGCPEVKLETFKEHPDSFYGYFYFSMTLDVLCCTTFFLSPWLSILFGTLTLLLFLFHFVMYKPVIDRFFPEKESINVTAIRPCRAEVKRRIFLNGHTDAAWEFPLNYLFGGIVFEIPGILAVFGIFYYLILSGMNLCGMQTGSAGVWGLLFLPFFLLTAITYNPRRVVDGANDNLSGCYLGIALLKEMEEKNIDLEHTEVGVILTGSEEAGLRGAKAWSQAHQQDYQDVPTYILSFDTIHDPRFLMVNRRDLNGTLPADEKLGFLFLEAAQEGGIPCKNGWVPPMGGATDSAAFTQGGFHSVGITGLNHNLEDYYHTRKDSYDNLNADGLENCYKAVLYTLEKIDSGKLDD